MAKTETVEPKKRGRKPGWTKPAGLKLSDKIIGKLFVNYAMDKKITKADKLKFFGIDEKQFNELLRQAEKLNLLNVDFEKALESGAVKISE
jgi:hypothetical protein